jgi:wobble nucleotide-excising tRNase
VPTIALNAEVVAQDWQSARIAVLGVLEAKRAAPLERLEIPENVRRAIRIFDTHREAIARLNQNLQEANGAIRAVKERALSANPVTIEATLNNLRAVRNRHTPPISDRCEEYLTAKQDKAVTERARDAARAALERYRADAFPSYQSEINAYIGRFNAGYRIDRVSAVDTRGGPTCNYSVVINETPVAISGGVVPAGEPAFRNILSSGDRNTLALAFFLASMERDPNLARKILVIDDPISSLDEHRTMTTVQELRRLGRRVSQMIILSHNKPFLCSVWEGLDSTQRTALQIVRDANGSTIVPWDVDSDSTTILSRRDAQELRDLAEYAHRFHHDTNQAWQTETVNDVELRGFVDRVLVFCRK